MMKKPETDWELIELDNIEVKGQEEWE